MLKRFKAMSRKMMLMLSALAVCALGIGTAMAMAGANDTDDFLPVAAKTNITAATNRAAFRGSANGVEVVCESEGGIETTVVNQPLPFTAPVNKPALSFTKCNNGATVKVNGEIKLTLDSADNNPEVTGADPSPEDKDTGTLTVPSTSSIVITVPLPACTITISGQSFTGVIAEEPAATLTFTNVAVPYTATGSGCGSLGVNTPSGTGLFTAKYTVSPSTLDDES
jgi:hypothetical protein